jgi:GNAT superfamily N-acetyltransferase
MLTWYSSRMVAIREAPGVTEGELRQLTDLLVTVVNDGAAMGFIPPIGSAEADEYWRDLVANALGPSCILLLAEDAGRIVGTAQLHLATKHNGLHRAEVAKVMVHPSAQRRGIARAMLARLDEAARRERRTLLILDTREGDPSNDLYRLAGYTEAGRIPEFARSADGSLHTTVLYYKILDADRARGG